MASGRRRAVIARPAETGFTMIELIIVVDRKSVV